MPTPSGYVLVSDAFAKRMANVIMDKTRLSSSITGEAFPSAVSNMVTTQEYFSANVMSIDYDKRALNEPDAFVLRSNTVLNPARTKLTPYAFQWIFDVVSYYHSNNEIIWPYYSYVTNTEWGASEFLSVMYYSINLSNITEMNTDSLKIKYFDENTWNYGIGYIAASYPESLSNLHRINDTLFNIDLDGEDNTSEIHGIYPNFVSQLSIPNCSYIGAGAFANMDLDPSCLQSILTTYSSYSTTINYLTFAMHNHMPSNLDLTGYTSIASYAFYNTWIDESGYYENTVNAPNVTYIGDYAFHQCYHITSMYMSNVSYIGNYAFNSCSIYDISNNISNVTYIGDYAFHQCFPVLEDSGPTDSNVTSSIYIPNCSYIGEGAFNECHNLYYVDATNCGYIGSYAFQSCSNLSSISMPNVSYIGDMAFYCCYNLSSISIPNCNYIGAGAFCDCGDLRNLYLNLENNNNLTYLGNDCITTIYVEEDEYGGYIINPISNRTINCINLSYIGNNVFYGCSNLSSISIPNCSYIGDNTFAYCTSLSSISLPNCSYIGDYAFQYCSSLTNSCVQDILNTYKSYSNVINNGVFSNCTGITSLDLTGYTSIGDQAFNNCTSLSSISLPNCSYIGNYAFQSCDNLNSIYLSLDKLTYIGHFGINFSKISYLSSNIEIAKLRYIGNNVFYGCSNLSSISIPNCSYIGDSAFYSCSSLSSISSMPNCSYIGSSAFAYCTSLSSISIHNCNSINNYAFYNCTNLSYVDATNCSYIGDYAFYNCTSLSYISPMYNIRYIYPSTFYNCYNLSSISIHNCGSIYNSAFCKCSNLSYVDATNCTYIGSWTFQSCSNLTFISLPNCSYIGNYAFQYCSKLESIYILSTKVPSLPYPTAFYNTPLSNSTYLGHFGSIYVLSSLVDSFKTATNWKIYSSRIVAYTP